MSNKTCIISEKLNRNELRIFKLNFFNYIYSLFLKIECVFRTRHLNYLKKYSLKLIPVSYKNNIYVLSKITLTKLALINFNSCQQDKSKA